MRLKEIVATFKKYPQFTLMRSVARFPVVRKAVKRARSRLQSPRWTEFCALQRARLHESTFHGVDPAAFLDALRRDGVALGLNLPPTAVAELRAAAETATCYAERDYTCGFPLSAVASASTVLGKPILTAHYFNIEESAPVAARLRQDPLLLLVAAMYLESVPTHVGTNMWWSFPTDATYEDRARNAQVYHADIDDFAFLKYFFYLTDVDPGDGAHVCVPGSHRSPLVVRPSDRWNVRRYQDEEVETHYGAAAALEIHGRRGLGFAEDTLCIHRGTAAVKNPRLLIQIQYALFDHNVQTDQVDVALLKRII
jgi:hypothetical protein